MSEGVSAPQPPAHRSVMTGQEDTSSDQGDALSDQKDPSTDQKDAWSTASVDVVTVDTLSELLGKVALLDADQHLQALSEMFSTYCSHIGLKVPDDFIQCEVQGMQHLNTTGRTNFLYTLAKGLGTMRSDGEDSVFPAKQLIGGLFEYSANFFSSAHKSQVHIQHMYKILTLIMCLQGLVFCKETVMNVINWKKLAKFNTSKIHNTP